MRGGERDTLRTRRSYSASMGSIRTEWNAWLEVVAPAGSASFKIELIAVGTNLPIPNGIVTIQSATGIAIKGTTNADGVFEFTKVDPDNYKVLIQIEGKPDINETKEVNTGVNARMKVMVA